MRTYLLSGSRVPNKDVAGPAYSSTQLPSTVLWSATLHRYDQEILREDALALSCTGFRSYIEAQTTSYHLPKNPADSALDSVWYRPVFSTYYLHKTRRLKQLRNGRPSESHFMRKVPITYPTNKWRFSIGRMDNPSSSTT